MRGFSHVYRGKSMWGKDRLPGTSRAKTRNHKGHEGTTKTFVRPLCPLWFTPLPESRYRSYWLIVRAELCSAITCLA